MMPSLKVTNAPKLRADIQSSFRSQIASSRWIFSGVLLGGTVLFLGYGGYGLRVDGQCAAFSNVEWSTPLCLSQYDTKSVGGLLVGAGIALSGLAVLPVTIGTFRQRIPLVEANEH